MSRDFPMPQDFQDSARAWLDDPRPGPAPRHSATVLLLRDADRAEGGVPVQVFMLHRAATMQFAPNAYVFPGGGQEPEDVVPGESAEEPGDETLRRTAAREVTEETGVEVDPAGLLGIGHWVTPEFEPRRYSTHFYAARCPKGSEPQLTTTEAITGEWVDPEELLVRQDAVLLPPTIAHLEMVARARSVDDFLATTPEITAVTPVPVAVGEQVVIRVEDAR